MKVTTTDPMTGNDVDDLDNAPFVIEGKGSDALKIYFESEQGQQDYIEFAKGEDSDEIIDAYNAIRDNEKTGTIN